MSKPKVSLVSLDKEPWFDEMYDSFLSALKSKAEVTELTTPAQPSELFASRGANMPQAVLATDAALTNFVRNTAHCGGCIATDKPLRQCAKCHSVAYCDRKCQKEHWASRHKPACASLAETENPALAEQAASFVQVGGKIIFMGTFSSFARPSDIGPLFQIFDKPWSSGDYHRATFARNQDLHSFDAFGLAPGYSQKALQLSNVSAEDAVYYAGRRHAGASGQSPAVFGSSGEGKVGYIGDVNNEEKTSAVVFAMCGV